MHRIRYYAIYSSDSIKLLSCFSAYDVFLLNVLHRPPPFLCSLPFIFSLYRNYTEDLESGSNSNSNSGSDQRPILTESAAELMEVFREKSNYEGVVSVYEAMKTRGVTPGVRVRTLQSSFYVLRRPTVVSHNLMLCDMI